MDADVVDTETGFAAVVADIAVFGDVELTARFGELELVQRRVAAEMAVIAGEVDRRGVYRRDGHRALPGWLRAQGNYAGGSVSRTRRLARLFYEHPVVGEELYAGRIGLDQAAELGRARANPRCGEELGDVVQVLLEYAIRFDYDNFSACVQRWEILADLDGAHHDRGTAVEARRAAVVAGVDGVDVSASGGTALQAAEMVAILEAFVEVEFQRDLAERRRRAGADAAGCDLARTDAQRRFDALMAILRTANNSPRDETPAAATLNVVCDQYNFESALASHGLADEPVDLRQPDPTQARCETAAGTPLLPDDIVLAALGGWVRRVVTDSAGVVIDLGHRRRCFTGGAGDAARLLVSTCEHVGCTVPEAWSQIDHLEEWSRDGGATDQGNAGIDCGYHNRHKHRHRLRSRRDHRGKLHVQRPDGTWMTPVGTDPPTEYDFLTDEDLAERARQRLHDERAGD